MKKFNNNLEINVRHLKFKDWFVGYTDGDGCFSLYSNESTNDINWTYKLSQKSNNVQVLYFIKKQIGAGLVRDSGDGMAHYLLRDKRLIKERLIPIFDTYTLRTNKRYSYYKWKLAMEIWEDPEISSKEEKFKKIKEITPIITEPRPLTKDWLVGFIEAEGSFYIANKHKGKAPVHGFGLSLKNEPVILEEIRELFKINAKVKEKPNSIYVLDATGKETLKIIKAYFSNCLKGRKSLQYSIWGRSFKYSGNLQQMNKAQQLIRDLF